MKKKLLKITEIVTLPKIAQFSNYRRYRSQILIAQIEDFNEACIKISHLYLIEKQIVKERYGRAGFRKKKNWKLLERKNFWKLLERKKLLETFRKKKTFGNFQKEKNFWKLLERKKLLETFSKKKTFEIFQKEKNF